MGLARGPPQAAIGIDGRGMYDLPKAGESYGLTDWDQSFAFYTSINFLLLMKRSFQILVYDHL